MTTTMQPGAKPGVDLSCFDTVMRANQGVEMELKSLKTGQPSGAFITLLGQDSDVFRSTKEERSRQIEERVLAGNTEEFTPQEREDFLCELLARCTVASRGLLKNGQPLHLDKAAAYELYKTMPAIREQVNRYVGDRANFVLA